jgi:hypothetical protein
VRPCGGVLPSINCDAASAIRRCYRPSMYRQSMEVLRAAPWLLRATSGCATGGRRGCSLPLGEVLPGEGGDATVCHRRCAA